MERMWRDDELMKEIMAKVDDFYFDLHSCFAREQTVTTKSDILTVEEKILRFGTIHFN